MTSGRVWIWGTHPVLEALRSGTARRVLLVAGRHRTPNLSEIVTHASRAGVPVQEVSTSELQRLAPDAQMQGVAAEVESPRLHSVSEMMSAAAGSALEPFLLALDQIQDPHNYGALLRTAEAAGVSAVVVPESRSAPLTGTVAKTSAGAAARVPVLTVPNLARAVDEVKREGVWVVGLAGDAERTLYDLDLTIPLLLIVGSEGQGLRRLTRERCDFLARIPMVGALGSLNASVAGAIGMYEVLRQRMLTAYKGPP